jgi:hypothetical protein
MKEKAKVETFHHREHVPWHSQCMLRRHKCSNHKCILYIMEQARHIIITVAIHLGFLSTIQMRLSKPTIPTQQHLTIAVQA